MLYRQSMTLWKPLAFMIFSLILMLIGGASIALASNGVTINEIRIDQPSTDNDEFFELAGSPGTSLTGLTYIVIGDSGSNGGIIEEVTDLTGETIPASGFFVVAESSFTLGTADLTTSLSFENSDNVTHLLVTGFTGASGQDLDTDDNGTLETIPWSAVVDSVGLVESVGSGDPLYSSILIGPDGSFVPGHVYHCSDGWRIGSFSPGGNDTPGAANNCAPPPPLSCSDAPALIHNVQGSGNSSPIDGATGVVIQGVVVGDFQGSSALSGFFLQEEDADVDADPMTSEGIFVFDGSFGVDVSVGEVVSVRGTVDEYFGLTELTNVNGVVSCGAGTATAASITLPVTSVGDWEFTEGMLITIPHTLFATDNYGQARYGEVHVSVGSQLFNPTHVAAPGAPANAVNALNDRSRILMDDGSGVQNPLPLPPYLGAGNTLRTGDTIPSLTGVLSYGFGSYRVHPTTAVSFNRVNARQASPSVVGGTLSVASFNVLNYFTTLDNAGPICGPVGGLDCRGADNAFEFTRQRDKIIDAIVTMDADIVGLMELENNSTAAIQDLVNGLDVVAGVGTYSYIDSGTIGSDAIKVAFIYQPANATPVGSFAILDSSVDPSFLDTKNRPSLAQTFRDNTTGDLLTVAVNHFKSKGSACDDVGDFDLGDEQGNCNLTRTSAAIALANWLAGDPTGSGDPDFLIIGDLNAYAMEDPVTALTSAGYSDLIATKIGSGAHSYVYFGESGYLDYALSNASLVTKVTNVTEWHINADEPSGLNYNDFNQPQLYNADPFRSSDHDPVVVGIGGVCTDTTPPVIDDVILTPNELWPANHKYMTVNASFLITDVDPDVTVTLISVTSSEPDNGLGDGDKENDIVVVSDTEIQLRAERSGTGEGRTYALTFNATDFCGNTITASAEVFVPHSKGK